jgi:hypothetical protein
MAETKGQTMTDTDRDFWIAIRAAKINQAKILEQQRREIMAEIAAIESRYGIESSERPRQVRMSNNDPYAGIVKE